MGEHQRRQRGLHIRQDEQELEPEQERHLRHQQRQIEKRERAPRRAPGLILPHETQYGDCHRNQRGNERHEERGRQRLHQIGHNPHPVAQIEARGQKVGILPEARHRPKTERQQADKDRTGGGQHDGKRPPAQDTVAPKTFSRASHPVAQACAQFFEADPDQDRSRRDAQLQHCAGRCQKAPGKVGIVHPVD
ncbi:hypothetical protein [Nitratireductor aquibiodomus]|uniref:hypothetical protein n=1 Tax=Nitratireductor aquibiodomus TaxID=204799 RepID=UPI002FDCF34F